MRPNPDTFKLGMLGDVRGSQVSHESRCDVPSVSDCILWDVPPLDQPEGMVDRHFAR
jgi:hypothetical protein